MFDARFDEAQSKGKKSDYLLRFCDNNSRIKMFYSPNDEADDIETKERLKTYIYRRRLIKLAQEEGYALFAKLKMQKMIECEGYLPSSLEEFEPIAMAAWAQIGKKDRVYYAFIQK